MESFIRDLVFYLTGYSNDQVVEKTSRLINKCVSTEFDFTFPSANKLVIWQKCTNQSGNEPSFKGLLRLENQCHDYSFSKEFQWPISLIQIKGDNVLLRLDRSFVCDSILKDVCSKGIIASSDDSESNIRVINCELQRPIKNKNYLRQFNQLRVNQICSALGRLLSACGHKIAVQENGNSLMKGIKCIESIKYTRAAKCAPVKLTCN